jgi:predicted TIM-barrel fold metal-dependent hydrolase
MPVILIRMGLKADRYFYPLVRKCPNTFIEISNYLTNNGIEKLRSYAGAEKLIFGTGMPVYNPVPAITLLKLAEISAEDKLLIGSGNMERLLSEVELR